MDTDSVTLLPVRFAPEQDELFSSWLSRLAMAHTLKLHTFTKFVFLSRKIWNRDIDKSADNEHIKLICQQTGLPYQRIFTTTLCSFEGSMYETHNANGNLSWIMPVGVHRLARKGFGLQICPLCLFEDKAPYYRRHWRLSWITTCSKHKILLLDRCPDCQNPIMFHRGDMGWRNQAVSVSMIQCSVCDLCWTSSKVINSLVTADSDVTAFQNKIENTLINSWIEMRGFGMVHSINFFNGLKHILHVLSVSRRTQKFREAVSLSSKISINKSAISESQVRSFHYLPVEFRYQTIKTASWLIKNWHEKFIEIALNTKTFSSALLPYNETPPFWYWSPIHKYLIRKSHPVSEKEIFSALEYLESRKTFILPMDLEFIIGRNFFEYKTGKFIISIYERMKKFNEIKERERIFIVKKRTEFSSHKNECSKVEANTLFCTNNQQFSESPKHYKKTQKMYEQLIIKYKRRERLKMATSMENKQNSSVVAKQFAVSPRIVMKWYLRFKVGGINNLDDQSRCPTHFPHQIVFQKQENWIRLLHAEGLELLEIQRELKIRHNFDITPGGLYRVLNRLNLVLPCSAKNRFAKKNRKISLSNRILRFNKNT